MYDWKKIEFLSFWQPCQKVGKKKILQLWSPSGVILMSFSRGVVINYVICSVKCISVGRSSIEIYNRWKMKHFLQRCFTSHNEEHQTGSLDGKNQTASFIEQANKHLLNQLCRTRNAVVEKHDGWTFSIFQVTFTLYSSAGDSFF